MSITFTTCAAGATRCAPCQDAPPAPAVQANNLNALQLLQKLDYPPIDPTDQIPTRQHPAQADAVDFQARALLALAFCPEATSYAYDRLTRLHDLAQHAMRTGCLITWFQE